MVDGLEQAPVPAGRLFALPEAAAARLLAFEDGAAGARLAGEHRGFAAAGVVHAREIVVLESGVVVVDRLAGRGGHHVELRWPLATAEARVRPATRAEAAALARVARDADVAARPDLARVAEVPLGDAGRLVLALDVPGDLAPELSVALRSPGYGELAPGAVILAAGRASLPATLVTLLFLLPSGAEP
jgi:hypothetical protein